MQTCQVTSVVSQVHDWVLYRLGDILGSVVHRVKIHKIRYTTDKGRGDLEIKDYLVLQKSQEQDDRLPPPRTLILYFTLIHTCYGRSYVHPIVGLILEKVSTMRISIPFDLSSRSFIPLPCFIRSRLPTTLLVPSLVFPPNVLAKRHMMGFY